MKNIFHLNNILKKIFLLSTVVHYQYYITSMESLCDPLLTDTEHSYHNQICKTRLTHCINATTTKNKFPQDAQLEYQQQITQLIATIKTENNDLINARTDYCKEVHKKILLQPVLHNLYHQIKLTQKKINSLQDQLDEELQQNKKKSFLKKTLNLVSNIPFDAI